ncbi:MIP/aquaporin family protein [Thermoanaerobacter sp. X514]|uniref:MIP/aquaporin family protein n=1 Tax=Thermoanaerobacter sp. (strain X514) TaxID=399726 RepID=UPI0000E1DD71|nr:MIP/aquaporin family protein [Thermoanaerobacter sp. X514]ABY92318.1 MIP family channel protein [Thermoanaerobacter sp. X514]
MSDLAKYVAEFFGTMILIWLGDGVVANVVLNKSKGQNSGWIVITAGWGFAVMVAVYVVGWISGAHINPAVTLGLATIGNFPWSLVPGYIIAQVLGAFVGAIIVYLMYMDHFAATDDPTAKLGTFATIPAIRNLGKNFMTEAFGTAMLLIGILGITNSNNSVGGMGALLVGLLVWAIGLSLGGPTGYAINPARDFGPRLAHAVLPIPGKGDSDWGYGLIVPIFGPIVGGILGAIVYQLIVNIH